MANLWDPVIVYDSAKADYWTNQTVLDGTQLVPVSSALCTGSIMEVHYSRTVPTGVREDLAMFSFHLAVEAGPGAPMSRLDAADAQRVEDSFIATWLTAMNPKIANDWSLKEFAWRHFGADFPLDKNGLSKPGPYWRLKPVAGNNGGDSSPRMPDQVALTTTFRTASRKHWGRYYAGGFTSAALLDSLMGHATTTVVDALATGTHDWLVDINNDSRKTNLWIWSPKYLGACAVNELSVDDTWDVIRSRRAKFPTYRKTFVS